MWQKLRKLVGAERKDEAREAIASADRTLQQAERQAVQASKLTGRIIDHGTRNHFGERIEAAIRGA
jgi:hypothetical protein